ncbi:hypothetical protein [Caldiplasma sukawensis]
MGHRTGEEGGQDIMIFDKLRERKNRKIDETIQKEQSKNAAMVRVQQYVSIRQIIRKSFPLILVSIVLAFLEYDLIGCLYTFISLVIYLPVLYFYTKSVRPVRGKFVMEIKHESGSLNIIRYLIPDELFELIDFDHTLVPGLIRFNGHETYLATKVWKFDNGVIYRIKLAWLHFNQLEYARNSDVLDKAILFATNLAVENSELEKLKEFESILEGKRQKKEQIELIDKSYRENPELLKKRIEDIEKRINLLVTANEDLLYGPYRNKGDEEKEEEVEET